MNNVFKLKRMNKEKWVRLKSLGLARYLILEGYIKIGFSASFFGIVSQYLYDIQLDIERMNLDIFIFEYIKWIPILALLGVIVAIYSWIEFNNEFE